ncbi:MAG: PLP-dependent aminotransferase family protein, partial [Ruthenibacterium sp.]
EKPQGGMFLWVLLPENRDVKAFTAACLAQKLALVPGYAFLADDTQPCQAVRLNFSSPTIAQIEAGTDILAEVLRNA